MYLACYCPPCVGESMEAFGWDSGKEYIYKWCDCQIKSNITISYILLDL